MNRSKEKKIGRLSDPLSKKVDKNTNNKKGEGNLINTNVGGVPKNVDNLNKNVQDGNIFDKIKQLNVALIENETQIAYLKQENESFTSQIVNFVNKCRQLQQINDNKEAEIGKFKKTEKQMSIELETLKKEKEDLKKKITSLINIDKNKNIYISKLEEENEKYLKELEEKKEEIKKLNENIKKGNNKMGIMETENNNLKQEIQNNQRKLNELNTIINEKENNISSLDETKKKSNLFIKEKKEEIENYKKKIQQQNNKIQILNEKIQIFEKEQKTDKEQIKKQTEQIKILKKLNNTNKNDQKYKNVELEKEKEEKEKEKQEDMIFKSQFYNLKNLKSIQKNKKNKTKQTTTNNIYPVNKELKNNNSPKNSQTNSRKNSEKNIKNNNIYEASSDSSSTSSDSIDTENVVSFKNKYNLQNNKKSESYVETKEFNNNTNKHIINEKWKREETKKYENIEESDQQAVKNLNNTDSSSETSS